MLKITNMKTINNKQYEECFVVMLATNKAEDCLLIRGRKLEQHKQYFTQSYLKNLNIKSYHLYILSDDEIKEGDWFIEFDLKGTRSSYCNTPFLCDIENTGVFILTKNNGNFPFPENCKKIIATTDKSLKVSIKGITTPEGVYVSTHDRILPQIPQSFIEHYIEQYNKGNVIDKVLVEYTQIYQNNMGVITIDHTNSEPQSHWGNVINNIPKINPDNTINILTQKDSWTRDEVIALIEKHTTDMFKQRITLDEWISKNL